MKKMFRDHHHVTLDNWIDIPESLSQFFFVYRPFLRIYKLIHLFVENFPAGFFYEL